MWLNLKKLASRPQDAIPIHGRNPELPNPLTDITNRVIDTSLRKFLTPEEADQVITGYRRSPWNEDALNRDIEKLNSDYHEVLKDEHYENALQHVKKLLTPERLLQPVHFADLRHYKWRLSTNIGAPFASSKHWQKYVKAKFEYFRSGKPFENTAQRDLFTEAHKDSQPLEITDARMTKHNLYTEAFYVTRENIHKIKNNEKTDRYGNDLRYWNTAFARQHLVEKDEDDKVRLVFGAPFTLLCAELMFIWPLQVFLLTMTGSKAFMLWGFETILGGWYRLRNFFSRYAPQHDTTVTIDWSGFDRFARHTVIRDIHARILRPMFDFSNGYQPTKDYPYTASDKEGNSNAQRIENLWNWMTDSILTIPLLMPDGTLYSFQHSGIFSGYFQTQILDSIYNLVMIFTILSRMGFNLDKVIIKVQGDDSIFVLLCVFLLTVNSFMTLFRHYATIYFGSKLNDKKSAIQQGLDGAEVLKYTNKNGIPTRPELALLAQLRHPERRTDPNAVAARCIGIAYASCGQLPRTYQICEDVFNYLTKKYDAKPAQTELDFMFRHLDIKLDASKFPSYYDTMSHLMDGPSDKTDSHWPKDYFTSLPGRL